MNEILWYERGGQLRVRPICDMYPFHALIKPMQIVNTLFKIPIINFNIIFIIFSYSDQRAALCLTRVVVLVLIVVLGEDDL